MTATFVEKLQAVQQQRDSWLCIGLDPSPELMPDGVDVLSFSKSLIDATADLVCAYKPNLAFYMAYGMEGLQALKDITAYVPAEIPIVLDAKFGDISYTAAHYAKYAYEVLGVDAVTVNPYVGMDAVTPFLEDQRKTAFVLVRSSNTTGNDFQLWPSQTAPLFRFVTAQLNTLSRQYPEQLGIGVAATQARDLGRIRCWAPTLPFLIPGLGEQGGDLAAACEQGLTRTGIGPLMSVTRSIIYASRDRDYAAAARTAASAWLERIHEARVTPSL